MEAIKEARRLPRLPPELLLPIIEFAVLDEPLRTRYDALLSYCHVSRTFCGVAQPLLYQDARPASFSSWRQLAENVQKDGRLAFAVRHLALSQRVQAPWRGSSVTGTKTPEVLRDLPNLRTLVIHAHLDSEIWDLPVLPCVQHLSLPLDLFLRSHLSHPGQVPFPDLRYLILTDERLPPSQRVETISNLPASVRGIVAPIATAQHIDHLPLSSYPILWTVPWQAFVNYMPPWRSFPDLNHRIKHLYIFPIRWTPPPHYLDELVRRVSTDPSLAELEVLFLPKQWEGIGTEEGRVEWERILSERGVAVEHVGEEDASSFGEVGERAGILPGAFVRRCEADYVSRQEKEEEEEN